jgi:hypothetical protein
MSLFQVDQSDRSLRSIYPSSYSALQRLLNAIKTSDPPTSASTDLVEDTEVVHRSYRGSIQHSPRTVENGSLIPFCLRAVDKRISPVEMLRDELVL